MTIAKAHSLFYELTTSLEHAHEIQSSRDLIKRRIESHVTHNKTWVSVSNIISVFLPF